MHNGSAISYREFAGRVRGTARRYRSVGIDADGSVGPIGALVAPEPAVGQHLLAILQARATYCPIDATQPIARQEVLAAALGLDRLFAVAAHRRGPANLQIDRLADYPPRPDAELPQAKPGDPAYALCTSGSTGSPKPVLVPHGALAVTVRALRKLFELTPEDRVLQFASLGWDTCLEEILPALTAGAALVFDDAAHSGSFQSFIRMLTNQKITVVDLPTAFWHEFVLFLSEEPTTLPESLRLVVIGGERVDPTRLRQWRALPVGRIRLLNTYGCTETEWVQLITWNDYAESTAMAPSVAHGWRILDVNAYDIARFKWGRPPRITRDALFASYRSQPAAARPVYPETLLMHPVPDSTAPRDAIEVVSFATAPGRIDIVGGDQRVVCQAGAGRGICLAPLRPGVFRATLTRGGVVVAAARSEIPVTERPFVQDLQYRLVGGLR